MPGKWKNATDGFRNPRQRNSGGKTRKSIAAKINHARKKLAQAKKRPVKSEKTARSKEVKEARGKEKFSWKLGETSKHNILVEITKADHNRALATKTAEKKISIWRSWEAFLASPEGKSKKGGPFTSNEVWSYARWISDFGDTEFTGKSLKDYAATITGILADRGELKPVPFAEESFRKVVGRCELLGSKMDPTKAAIITRQVFDRVRSAYGRRVVQLWIDSGVRRQSILFWDWVLFSRHESSNSLFSIRIPEDGIKCNPTRGESFQATSSTYLLIKEDWQGGIHHLDVRDLLDVMEVTGHSARRTLAVYLRLCARKLYGDGIEKIPEKIFKKIKGKLAWSESSQQFQGYTGDFDRYSLDTLPVSWTVVVEIWGWQTCKQIWVKWDPEPDKFQ